MQIPLLLLFCGFSGSISSVLIKGTGPFSRSHDFACLKTNTHSQNKHSLLHNLLIPWADLCVSYLSEGGTRSGGRVRGKGRPVLAISTRCIARINSSALNCPSRSTSARALKTEIYTHNVPTHKHTHL